MYATGKAATQKGLVKLGMAQNDEGGSGEQFGENVHSYTQSTAALSPDRSRRPIQQLHLL